MKKQILGTILAALMICLFIPTTVWAGQTFYVDADNGDDGNDGTSESQALATLAKAVLKAGTTETTIKLLSDVTISPINIGTADTVYRTRTTITVRITLDLNGCTVLCNGNKNAIFNVWGDAEFTIDDTSSAKSGIIRNESGGVHGIENMGVLNLKGGTISCKLTGLSWPGGGVCQNNNSIFNMSGGAIKDCYAGSQGGGGVYVGYESGGSIFNMTGGTISNCSSSLGGGVYVAPGADSVNISGNAKIIDNTTSNIYIANGKTINIDNPGKNMKVGITMANPGTFSSNEAYDYKEYFSSDNTSYDVGYTADKKLMLGTPAYDITYKDMDGAAFSGTHDNPDKHITGSTTFLKDARKSGYTFEGWYQSSDCSGDAVKKLTDADSSNSTLFAKWAKGSSSGEPQKDKKDDKKSELTREQIMFILESLSGDSDEEDSSDDEEATIAKSNAEAAEKEREKEKTKSIYPSKSLVSNTIANLKQTYDVKALNLSPRDDVNQQFLANSTAASHGKRAKIIANCAIYPNRDLSITENGSMQILTWSNLSYKTPGNVYAVCYNQIDGVYVISGTIDRYGTAKLINYRLRPATNITIYVEY